MYRLENLKHKQRSEHRFTAVSDLFSMENYLIAYSFILQTLFCSCYLVAFVKFEIFMLPVVHSLAQMPKSSHSGHFE